MDIKSFLPKKKEEEELFWSVIIEPEWVSAGIWKIDDGKVNVLSISTPSAWSLDEELLSACDTACSQVVQSLSEDIEPPKKTVFGVVSSWVEGGEIKEKYISKIKRVCSELALSPVGFVVLSEALSNYYKSEEGSNVSAVFLGVSQESMELSIFRLGKLAGVSQIARSVSPTDDVIEGLSRFYTGEPYPSRIILYNAKDDELDEIKQDLIKADWEGLDEIQFLHTPKVEIVNPEKKIYAVCLAGGAEMGNVEKVVSNILPEKETDIPETSHEQVVEPPLPETPEGQENVLPPDEEITPEDFGFNVDTSGPSGITDMKGFEENSGSLPQNNEMAKSNIVKEEPPVKNRGRVFAFFGNLKHVFRKPKISLPGHIVGGKKPLLAGLLFIPLVLLFLAVIWYTLPKAKVTVYVSPMAINDEVGITIDTSSSSSDLSGNVVAGEMIEKSGSGEKLGDVSGTKVVGDKAAGEITIYRSGSSISLTKDTLVKGPQGLTFSLDNDITVASGSVITRGITKAKVTAKEIGAQYNLASGSTFSISNYSTSDMEATNESAFSGGSSREVSAVSDADQKKLLSSLQTELEEKLKTDLSESISDGKILIEDSVSYEIMDKDFDKKPGDEATSLSLTLDISARGIAVKKEDIEKLAADYLSKKTPSGYILNTEEIETDFSFEEGEDEGVYTIELKISADLLPQVNEEEIIKNIKGKFPEAAHTYLSSNVPGFERAVVDFVRLPLPGKLGTLPRIAENITISVNPEK